MNELLAVGLIPEYADDLMATTHASGRVEVPESVRSVKYGQGQPVFWNLPIFERRRLNELRVSHRLQVARELVGIEPFDLDKASIELAEETNVLPPTESPIALRTDRRRQLLSFVCGVIVLGVIALLLYFVD